MMLPEHVKLLREWKQEADEEAPRVLAEWELDDLQQTIEQALTSQQMVKLTVWQDTRYVDWTGIITKLNQDTLSLETITTVKRIPFHMIHAARLEADFFD